MKILICDDSMFVRKKMRDAVVKAGVTDIVDASDGQQAVDKYKAEKPDLVFMDIIMPVKSGVDALTEIKAFDSSAKIVMASSVGTQENLKEAILAGAYDFLQKPIANDDVAKIVVKIYDHTQLVNYQIENMNAIFAKRIADAKVDLHSEIQGVEKEYKNNRINRKR